MIEITNLTKQKIDNGLIVKKVEQVLNSEKAKNWDISICLATCAKIKELNKKFRGKDKPTDVLSFAELEVKGNKTKVGQVIICPIKVKENAKEFGRSFQEELKLALIHSVLHLLGYEHEKSKGEAEKMRRKEQKYIKMKNEKLKMKNDNLKSKKVRSFLIFICGFSFFILNF